MKKIIAILLSLLFAGFGIFIMRSPAGAGSGRTVRAWILRASPKKCRRNSLKNNGTIDLNGYTITLPNGIIISENTL